MCTQNLESFTCNIAANNSHYNRIVVLPQLTVTYLLLSLSEVHSSDYGFFALKSQI